MHCLHANIYQYDLDSISHGVKFIDCIKQNLKNCTLIYPTIIFVIIIKSPEQLF